MTRKKTARLEREIATALAAGPAVTISVHEDIDEKTGDETYTISDNGGKFDDAEKESWAGVQGDIDKRRSHYQARGRRVVLDVPNGRGWRSDRKNTEARAKHITPTQLRCELAELLERAGLDPKSVRLVFSDKLDREHATNRRRYASVYLDARRIEVARAILGLPERHRLGILAHEVGHFHCDATIGRKHTEKQTDRCAQATGVRIGYDHSWPGKGLQYATNLASLKKKKKKR